MSIPTRKEIEKFYEGEVPCDYLEYKIITRWNQALVFHAKLQEKEIKILIDEVNATGDENGILFSGQDDTIDKIINPK